MLNKLPPLLQQLELFLPHILHLSVTIAERVTVSKTQGNTFKQYIKKRFHWTRESSNSNYCNLAGLKKESKTKGVLVISNLTNR